MSVGPIVYTIVAEIGSTRLRTQTVVLGRSAYYVANIIGGVLQPYFMSPTAWNAQGKTVSLTSTTHHSCPVTDSNPYRPSSGAAFLCSPPSGASSAYRRLRTVPSRRWTSCSSARCLLGSLLITTSTLTTDTWFTKRPTWNPALSCISLVLDVMPSITYGGRYSPGPSNYIYLYVVPNCMSPQNMSNIFVCWSIA